MRIAKKIRCASCKKRIGAHEPDLVLEDLASGKPRYFHVRCEGAAGVMALERPGAYVLTIRYVDAQRN